MMDLILADNRVTKWWVGNPLPVLMERVYQITADGDEMELILALLRKHKEQKDAA